MDYACAFLHIFCFNNVVVASIMCVQKKNTWHTPTSADRTSTAGARASTVEYSRSHFFSQNWPWLVNFFYLFSFVLSGTTTTTWRVQRVVCVGGMMVFHHRPNEPIATERKMLVLKQRHVRKLKKLFCQVAGWLGCRYIGRIGRSLYGPAAREITVLG